VAKPKNVKRRELDFSRLAVAEMKTIPALLQNRVVAHIQDLVAEGCRAASYALSGPHPWPSMCSTHIDGWRVICTFPDDETVAILRVCPHDDTTDPYAEIANDLGIAVSVAERTKPPCCEGGVPTPPGDLLDALDAAFARLTRREQRDRSERRT
jgi:mRNA-degrading endonuclease RelE of RelBE toxin-antitoxin system